MECAKYTNNRALVMLSPPRRHPFAQFELYPSAHATLINVIKRATKRTFNLNNQARASATYCLLNFSSTACARIEQ